jgi:hypothetical protein
MKILLLVILVSILLFSSCNNQKELFKKTDYLVGLLDTTYTSFGFNGKHITFTSDSTYKLSPVGRLIFVKIIKSDNIDDDSFEIDNVTKEPIIKYLKEYEKLEIKLEKHYKNDKRVRNIYICNGGTIIIDCRN